jgi:hypothetical protein
MTTAQRKLNYQNSGLPSVSNFLNPILDVLRMHGGKAASSELKTEVEVAIRKRYQLVSLTPSLVLEIQYRLERALDLLNKGGLICKAGLHSLKLTSKALVVPKNEVAALAAKAIETEPMDIVVESEKSLPLPDDISLDILEFLQLEKRLSELELEERVLRRYACDKGILAPGDLDQIRRRALTARRIIEARRLIEHDRDGMYRLTALGRSVNPKQARRITGLSIGMFLRREIMKFRLFVERKAHLEVRKNLIREIQSFIIGLGRYLTKKRGSNSARNANR